LVEPVMRTKQLTLIAGHFADLLGLPPTTHILQIDDRDLLRTGILSILVEDPQIASRALGSIPPNIGLPGSFVISSRAARMAHLREVLFGNSSATMSHASLEEELAEPSVTQEMMQTASQQEELRQPTQAAADTPRRSIQLDEVVPTQAEYERTAMTEMEEYREQVTANEDTWPQTYEDLLPNLFDVLKDLHEYPTADAFVPTVGTNMRRFMAYSLARLRRTWQSYRNTPAPFVAQRQPTPAERTLFMLPCFVMTAPSYVTASLSTYVNPDGYSSEQILAAHLVLIRIASDYNPQVNWPYPSENVSNSRHEIVSLIQRDSGAPSLDSMNAIGAHPDQAGVVRCRWCSSLVDYDGRDRLCAACGGLL
jgi:hypothetical protein